MQFFQNLSAVANRPQQRHQTSEQEYAAGMQCLAQAQEAGFGQPDLLKQASDHFLAAIRHNYRHPEPYVGMAYLLMLIEDYRQAMKYICEALRIDPGNQGALGLQAVIREQAEAPADEPQLGSDEDEADNRYDRLEDLLDSAIRQISAMSPQPVTEPEALASLSQRFAKLQNTYGQLLERCDALGDSMELISLHARLRTIESRVKLHARTLQLSAEMLSLREQMDDEYEAAAFLCRHLVFQPPELAYHHLESILDSCDSLADQIDLLEERGTDISVLKTDYRRLTGMVRLLQETIDEMKG